MRSISLSSEGPLPIRGIAIDQLAEEPMVVALPSGHPLAPSADKAVLLQSLAGEGALKRIEPRMQPNEWGLPNAFDSHRDLICAAAAKAYRRGRKGSCESTPADF